MRGKRQQGGGAEGGREGEARSEAEEREGGKEGGRREGRGRGSGASAHRCYDHWGHVSPGHQGQGHERHGHERGLGMETAPFRSAQVRRRTRCYEPPTASPVLTRSMVLAESGSRGGESRPRRPFEIREAQWEADNNLSLSWCGVARLLSLSSSRLACHAPRLRVARVPVSPRSPSSPLLRMCPNSFIFSPTSSAFIIMLR